MKQYENIAVAKDGKILNIEIKTKTPNKNYISIDLIDEIDSLLSNIDYEGTSVLVIRGNRKVFSLGAAISEYADSDRETIGRFIDKGNAVFDRISNLPIISISAVQGYALGGGFELALSCDFILLSTRARLGLVESNIGVLPGWGGFYKLAKKIGLSRSFELTMKGSIIDAEFAYNAGIANAIYDSLEFEEKTNGFCRDIINKDNENIRAIKKLYSYLNKKDEGYFSLEKESFLSLWNERSIEKIKNLNAGS